MEIDAFIFINVWSLADHRKALRRVLASFIVRYTHVSPALSEDDDDVGGGA